MKRTHKVVPAGTFKARCLSLLDRVARTGEPLVVTKRGKAVAKVVPLEIEDPRPLRRSIRYHGDIVAPLGEEWEAES